MRRIRIVEHQAAWRALFAAEQRALARILGGIEADIHHIGSTAVAGLAAKPKIDIDAVIRSAPLLAQALEAVRSSGSYECHGDPHGDEMWTFTRGQGSGVRVYLCGPGNRVHEERVAFRDWLRSHAEDAADYAALKRKLAREAEGDFERYTCGKRDFVAAILVRAGFSAASGPAARRP